MDERVRAVAAAQLSVLQRQEVLGRAFEGRPLDEGGTPIHDLNGTVLFERVLTGDGYVDIAVAPELGAPVVAIAERASWDPSALIEQATAALKRKKARDYDETRFVAYSMPKIAVQFLQRGEPVALIECYTGLEVPYAETGRGEKATPPGNFEAWSYLDLLPRAEARKRVKRFAETVDVGFRHLEEARDLRPIVLADRAFLIGLDLRRDTRELHYSDRAGDHLCYELRGQETNVWCVGASVQMILDFYRYCYSQTRLAVDLGLGTKANPNGLPYSRDSDVVTVLENLSGKALAANMNTSPTFAEYRSEIRANRPLISFVPGHSRTVAGYTDTRLPLLPVFGFQGVLVYDPWPPNAGVITRWENYNATTYRRTFTARLTLA